LSPVKEAYVCHIPRFGDLEKISAGVVSGHSVGTRIQGVVQGRLRVRDLEMVPGAANLIVGPEGGLVRFSERRLEALLDLSRPFPIR
jgi:hypothetical protein